MQATEYCPEKHFDARAKQFEHAPHSAVGVGDALMDRCIGAIQESLIKRGLADISRRTTLSNKRILDFGCGTGRWAKLLESYQLDYSGVDISGRMVELARRLHPEARFEKLQEGRIPFDDQSFDLAASLAVIHHNEYSQQSILLDELFRVLRPGGYLMFMEGTGVPNPASSGVTYYRTRHEWLDLAKESGLECVWECSASYAVLCRAFRRVCDRLVSASSQKRMASIIERVDRFFLFLDTLVDPWIVRLIPRRRQTRMFAILRKPVEPRDRVRLPHRSRKSKSRRYESV